MRMLSLYLRSDPNLRSITLDNNMFTDDGMNKLVKELEKNTRLAHLSIRGCTNVTEIGLQRLCDVISTTNTCLF
jgi:RNA:NAD 2'-phosphotransferase (TPT1/KptA family)